MRAGVISLLTVVCNCERAILGAGSRRDLSGHDGLRQIAVLGREEP